MNPMAYAHSGPSCRQREIADVYFRFKKPLAPEKSYIKMNLKEGRSSKRPTPDTLYRYTSLVRSACSPGRPTTLFRDLRTNPRVNRLAIGYHGDVAKISPAGATHVAVTQETDIGKEKCKRHRSFLQWWQYSVWRVALKMMQNVRSQAQALALLPQNCLARTAQVQWLSALPQAYSATTQAFAPASKREQSAPLTGRTTSWNRRRGICPAAVFCFGDER